MEHVGWPPKRAAAADVRRHSCWRAAHRGGVTAPLMGRRCRTLDWLDRRSRSTSLCAVAAIAVLARGFGEITSLTGRRRLRWIAWGSLLELLDLRALLCATVGVRHEPAAGAAAHGDSLGLVPLSFASGHRALSTRDVEVIIKRAVWRTPRSSVRADSCAWRFARRLASLR